jgi:hypothetical protein
LRPHFTVSHLRLPFSSPPTTRRVTVEVFDPASTRGCLTVTTYQSLYSIRTDHPENTASIIETCLPNHCIATVAARTPKKASHVIAISPVHWRADCCLPTSYKHSSYCWCLSRRCLAIHATIRTVAILFYLFILLLPYFLIHISVALLYSFAVYMFVSHVSLHVAVRRDPYCLPQINRAVCGSSIFAKR